MAALCHGHSGEHLGWLDRRSGGAGRPGSDRPKRGGRAPAARCLAQAGDGRRSARLVLPGSASAAQCCRAIRGAAATAARQRNSSSARTDLDAPTTPSASSATGTTTGIVGRCSSATDNSAAPSLPLPPRTSTPTAAAAGAHRSGTCVPLVW
jgi:hypothetical protein